MKPERNKFTERQEAWLALLEADDAPKQVAGVLMRVHDEDEIYLGGEDKPIEEINGECGYCCLGLITNKVMENKPVRFTSCAVEGWTYRAHFGALETHNVLLFEDKDAMLMHEVDGGFRAVDETGDRCVIQYRTYNRGPDMVADATYCSLANLNDATDLLNDGTKEHKFSFADIAAFVRANPWLVFTNFDSPKELPEGFHWGQYDSLSD